MSAAGRGEMLTRVMLAHVFSNALGQRITLTICLPAQVDKHKWRKHTMHAHTEVHAYAHFLPPGWQKCSVGSVIVVNVTCQLITVAGGRRYREINLQGDGLSVCCKAQTVTLWTTVPSLRCVCVGGALKVSRRVSDHLLPQMCHHTPVHCWHSRFRSLPHAAAVYMNRLLAHSTKKI